MKLKNLVRNTDTQRRFLMTLLIAMIFGFLFSHSTEYKNFGFGILFFFGAFITIAVDDMNKYPLHLAMVMGYAAGTLINLGWDNKILVFSMISVSGMVIVICIKYMAKGIWALIKKPKVLPVL